MPANRKVTDAMVENWCRRIREGVPIVVLAKKSNVARETVWRHVRIHDLGALQHARSIRNKEPLAMTRSRPDASGRPEWSYPGPEVLAEVRIARAELEAALAHRSARTEGQIL